MINNKYNLDTLEYPYTKYIYNPTKDEILNLAKSFRPRIYEEIPPELQNQQSSIERCYKKYIIIKENWLTNLNLNSITDLFTEQIRVKCVFRNNSSPLEYWNKNKQQVISKSQAKFKNTNIKSLREIMYQNIRLCNNFRVSLCLTILKVFKPKKWLDISAGWGDRLLSAILYSKTEDFELYCATDPNKDLHPLYQNMINTLVDDSSKHKFVLIEKGFENTKFQTDDFDIVFSSPPFFDLETYSVHEDDSLVKYNTQNSWADNFFKPMLINAYNHLRNGGKLILYIEAAPYVQVYLNKLATIMKYKGTIYSFDATDKRKVLRKVFVWKKIRDDKITDI